MAEQDIIIKIKATDEASPTVQAINEEISGVEQKLLALKNAGQETSDEFKNLSQKQEELTRTAKGFQELPLEEKLNQTKKRMMELAAAGKTNTSEFRRLSEEAGAYKRQIEGVEQTVQMLSVNGSKGMAVLTESVTAMTAGMAVAQGAIALFGEENEDLQKRMVQVQGAMSLAMGVQQLMNTLTQRSILLTEAYAAAQRVMAWTTGASTAAMNTFRTALVATGIGALLVAVGFLYQYISAQEEEIDILKKSTDELERYNEVQENSNRIMALREATMNEQVAAMKLAGKSESYIQAELLKTAKIREQEMKQVDLNSRTILSAARSAVIAEQAKNMAFLKMYADRAAMYGEDESQAKEYLKTWEENGKKLKDQLLQIEGEENKLNQAQIQRRTEILNIQLALKAARKSEAEEAKNLEAERVAIAWEAHSQVILANEKELTEFDKTVTEKLKKLGKGHRLYKQTEEDFAKARIAMIGRHGQEEIKARQEIDRQIADNAMAAENRKFDDQILAIGRGNAEVRKKQKEIAKVEEDRLRKQIEIFKNNCLETADLEIQLQNTIASNREAAYQDELQDIQVQASKRETLIYQTAKDMEQANAMILASNLQSLEDQRTKAIEYGQDITDIDKQIAQIRSQVTDQILKDGKRRMDAAEQVRRNAMKIGADERKALKLERQNALDDSEKLYKEDLKAYQDLLDAKLIAEEDFTATMETLQQERRNRDAAANKAYRDSLKSAGSSYAAEEIQALGNMMKSITDFRSTEYQRQIDQAQNAKEDEILQVELQYKRGLITAETYERQKASITDRYDKMAEGYERKKFETDKQAAIAQALISTYLAGVQVLSNTKGGATARVLAMAAVITAGLLQVATISKTQFRSSTAGQMTATQSLGGSTEPSGTLTSPQTTDLSTGAMNAPGGASGGSGGGMASGGGSQGSGSDSGNGSRNTEPVRAYVVERDIEQTSQRLRQISEFATL